MKVRTNAADFYDLGHGYDKEDDFIDDSEKVSTDCFSH